MVQEADQWLPMDRNWEEQKEIFVDMFIILTVVRVSWCVDAKHQIVYFKYVQFIICQ